MFHNLAELVEYLNSFDEFSYYKCTATDKILFIGIPLSTARRYGIRQSNLEKLHQENPLNLAIGWKTTVAPTPTFSIFNLVNTPKD